MKMYLRVFLENGDAMFISSTCILHHGMNMCPGVTIYQRDLPVMANSSIATAFFLFFLLTLSLLYSLWHFTNYDIS